MAQLEVPLQGDGRIDEERLVVVGVVDEVVADLHLGAEREVVGNIIPELRLGEDDKHTVALTWPGRQFTPRQNSMKPEKVHFLLAKFKPHTPVS